MSTNRRDFLKLAGAAAAAITSTAAAHAGVPASSVAKFDDEYDVVIIGSGFAGMACALKAGQAGKESSDPRKNADCRRQLRNLRRQRRLPGQPRPGCPRHQRQQGTLHCRLLERRSGY